MLTRYNSFTACRWFRLDNCRALDVCAPVTIRRLDMASVLNPQPEHLNQSAEAGEKLYREMYQAKFEHDHSGNFAAIDVLQEKTYFLGGTAIEALQKATKQSPNGRFHLIKVGVPAAFKVGFTLDDDVDW